MSDPYVESEDYNNYNDAVEQLHDIQEVAAETAADNGTAATGGEELNIFNEVASEFYDF